MRSMSVESTPAPYGAWESPITAQMLASASRPLSFPGFAGDELWWVEGRSEEAGRATIMRRAANGTVSELLPTPWSARNRVHEYGGRPWVAVPTDGGHALVFTHWGDHRMYRLDPGSDTPAPLTPEPAIDAGLRYSDLVLGPDDAEVWAVRERHDGDTITRHIVAIPVDGTAHDDPTEVDELVAGSDFLACPRPSADGRRLAWLAWDHPNMPWDAAELRVGEITPDGVVAQWRTVLGGDGASVCQPEWAGEDTLYAVCETTGWWNLYEVPLDGELRPLADREEEFGTPLWMLGFATYAPLEDGRLAVTHQGPSGDRLGVLDPASGELTDLDLPYTSWAPLLAGNGRRVTDVAAGTTSPPAVVIVDIPAPADVERIRRNGAVPAPMTTVRWATEPDELPDAAYLPDVEQVTLAAENGRDVHANVYPPKNPRFTPLEDERPPYVVFVHGGPTGQSAAELNLRKAYFTSRGLGVVDVNYGGSSGYGREYRERLRGQWGVVDVEDCVAAVRSLVERGDADGQRLAIRGGSAGGWTVLAAVTSTDAFACGASYFGVAELLEFAKTTHDFESRYLDGLIGPLPEAHDLYVERAPLSHVDNVRCPVLLLQGLEDEIVPPEQAELFRDALARKEIPHAYLPFEGEQHGFRKAETIVASTEAELSFYGQVMGFDPPGVPKLALSTGDGKDRV